jgi:nicotinamidase-related amidase
MSSVTKSLLRIVTSATIALAIASAALGIASPAHAQVAPGDSKRLLNAQNSALVFIDHQPQMAFAVQSIDRTLLTNNVAGLAETAAIFKVPTVLTTVAAKGFSGPIFPEITKALPNQRVIDRTTMNSWEDKNFRDAVKQTGRRKLVVAGLWTEVCVVMPVLAAIDEGYDVYVVTDASGGVSKESHDAAVSRMVQAGAVPVTWMQVLLEYQRDWARQGTYDAVVKLAQNRGGAYGTGLNYAKAMLGAGAGEGK